MLDGKTFAVAHLLAERGTPFAFVSGARREDVPPPLRQVPFLPKPYDPQDIERDVPGQAGASGLRVPAGAGARNLPRPEHPAQGPARKDTHHDAGRIRGRADPQRAARLGRSGRGSRRWKAIPSWTRRRNAPSTRWCGWRRRSAMHLIAVVNLVAEERQFFKAEIGLGVRETPLDVSICAHALLRRGPVRGARHHAGCALRLQPAGHRRAASALLCRRPAGDGGRAAARHALRAGPRAAAGGADAAAGLRAAGAGTAGDVAARVAPGVAGARGRCRGDRRVRTAIPHPGRQHAADGLGDPAGRLPRLLQPALVRIHRHAGRLDRRRRLERHVPPGRPGARLGALAAFAGQPASPTRSSTGCAVPMASIAGPWAARWRCATSRAASSAGSAPAPISRSRSRPRNSCASARSGCGWR